MVRACAVDALDLYNVTRFRVDREGQQIRGMGRRFRPWAFSSLRLAWSLVVRSHLEFLCEMSAVRVESVQLIVIAVPTSKKFQCRSQLLGRVAALPAIK